MVFGEVISWESIFIRTVEGFGKKQAMVRVIVKIRGGGDGHRLGTDSRVAPGQRLVKI